MSNYTTVPQIDAVVNHEDNPASIRPYTTKELSVLYQVPVRTFNKWLRPFRKRLGVRVGNWYNILQVEIIFTSLGIPNDAKAKASKRNVHSLITNKKNNYERQQKQPRPAGPDTC